MSEPNPDRQYVGLPWKAGGSDRTGIDCRGLSMLWLREELGFQPAEFTSDAARANIEEALNGQLSMPQKRGDLAIYRDRKTAKICHCAIYLGRNRYLHIFRGHQSDIVVGHELLRRMGLDCIGALSPQDTERTSRVLADAQVGDPGIWVAVIGLVLSIGLSVASMFLMPKPKLGAMRNQNGRYGFDNLFTQTNTQIPLPDLLGKVLVAGNSPYQSRIDQSQDTGDALAQRANKVVILCAGPHESIAVDGEKLKINGLAYNNTHWHSSGMSLNPAQTKAAAVDGTISGKSNRPSLSVYPGTHAIEVPVDVRAQWDRNFPVYGFSGCSYIVFRLIDSTKFSAFNMTVTVAGRKCRQFDEDGFVRTTVAAESLAGANGSKVRFKLAGDDIEEVTSVEVNGTAYSELSVTQQTGNVYTVNRLKGYIEFVTAPAAAATIEVDYTYFPRVWTQNPAAHLVYLLTEPQRGKGFPESKVNWVRALELRDYCDEQITWVSGDQTVVEPRFRCSYAIDYRRTVQEHLRAVLDSCYAYLFISEGKFVLKARTAGEVVKSFTEDDIMRDSFSSEEIARQTLANQIKVFYRSKDTYNAETSVTRDDENDQRAREESGNEGVVDDTLNMLAVDEQTQAERLGEMVLRENVEMVWVGEFKTARALNVEPGDIIALTHSSQPAWNEKEVRVEDISIDQKGVFTIKWSEYFAGAYI